MGCRLLLSVDDNAACHFSQHLKCTKYEISREPLRKSNAPNSRAQVMPAESLKLLSPTLRAELDVRAWGPRASLRKRRLYLGEGGTHSWAWREGMLTHFKVL